MNTKFYTGEGDRGVSSYGKKKIKKSDPLFGALGLLDHVNSTIGWCAVEAGAIGKKKPKLKTMRADLVMLQEALFVAQAEVASKGFKVPSSVRVQENHVAMLESLISRIDGKMPKLDHFVLPGGSELSARLDLARVSAREAERAMFVINTRVKLSPELLAFVNRLSSALFALARFANYELKVKESKPSY